MCLAMALGQIRSGLDDGTVFDLFQYAILLLLPTVILIRLRADRVLVHRLMGVMVAGAVVSALVGLTGTIESGQGRAIGLASHMNQLGMVSALCVPMAWVLPRRRLSSYLAAGVASVILLVALNDSGSRSGMIALIAVLGCCGMYVLRRKVGVLVALTIMTVGAALLLSATPSADPDEASYTNNTDYSTTARLTGDNVGRSNTYRSELLSESLDLLAPSTVLAGTGYSYSRAPHNIWIQTVVVGGIVALAGLLLVFLPWIGTALRGAFISWKAPPDRTSRCSRPACWASPHGCRSTTPSGTGSSGASWRC